MTSLRTAARHVSGKPPDLATILCSLGALRIKARLTSAKPQTAARKRTSPEARVGPQAEMMPAALFSHTAPWMSLAPSITGPLYLKLLFLRLRKKL
jgi:hypothetical protein